MTTPDQEARSDTWLEQTLSSGSLPLASGKRLTDLRPLRILPGRRVVCAGRLQGRPVLAKIFLGDKSAREAGRERNGIEALLTAGIPTPDFLGTFAPAKGAGLILLFEYLPEARTLQEEWSARDESDRNRLLERLLALLGRMHEEGFYSRDPHLDNFLITGQERLWAIDGGGYRQRRGPLSRRESVNNLGLLFSQFPPRVWCGRESVLEAYCRERKGLRPSSIRNRLHARERAWRHWRAVKLGKKVFRSCSEFRAIRHGGLEILHRRDLPPGELEQWLANGGLEPGEKGQMLKAGNSQTVWATRLAERSVVVKRYNDKGIWQRIRHALGAARPHRAWRNAHWLRVYGIPTPRPLACLRAVEGPMRGLSWIVTERATGFPAHHLPARQATPTRMEALADVVHAFGRNGLVHGDMKASNFIIGDQGVQVIDLDSLSRPRLPWLRRRGIRADRERFLRNWQDPALRARFEQLLEEAESRYRGNRSRRTERSKRTGS